VDAGPERIDRYLADLGDQAERRSEREWVVRVPSSTRGHVSAGLSCGERTLALRALYMRGPDRDHEEVYRRLLRKHLETRAWRFALDDAGDLYLVAEARLETLDADALDQLLGSLAACVDETFESILRTGFEVPEGMAVVPPPAP
jgi:hypothetical protein